MTTRNVLTVGDLFCGAGGFSEGFRQAGFRVKWAIDNWEPAVTTFRKNFPGTRVPQPRNLLDERSLDDLERVDVLVGGPPFTHFSLANKGGNGDLKLGLGLVARFLDAVELLKPDYWIMENVPNLLQILRRQTDPRLSEDRIKRLLPKVRVLHADQFGVPQSRRRLFAGNFPDPTPLEGAKIPMKEVILGLPPPLSGGSNSLPRFVHDPLYNRIKVAPSKLTDHFCDTTLSQTQVETAKMWKEHHPWYGKMQFPDSLERPSRTIAATATKSSRASIVIEDSRIGGRFRVPTVREYASLQGFPISYQFWASGRVDKQRLIGNAVPPPLARALATAIALEEGVGLPQSIDWPLAELPPPLSSAPPKARPHIFPILRHYRNFVRGTLPYSRVELDNRGTPSKYPIDDAHHLVGWRTVLVLGYATDYAAFNIDLRTAYSIAQMASQTTLEDQMTTLVEKAAKLAMAGFIGQVPDASSLQAKWVGRVSSPRNPDWVLHKVSQIARQVAGPPRRHKVGVKGSAIASLLRDKRIAHGEDFQRKRWERKVVDTYTASSLLSLSIAVKLVNEGREWLAKNWDKRYPPQPTIEALRFQHASDAELILPVIELR